MRKTLIALSAVAILGFVQSQAPVTPVPTVPDNYTVPAPVPVPVRKANNITVKFDEEAAKNASNSIFRVFKRLTNSAKDAVDRGVKDVENGLRDAYENTYGKMIIDYGKTFGPIFRAYGDIIEDVSVNATCNQTCAVKKCFFPRLVKKGLNFYEPGWGGDTSDLGFLRTCSEK